MDDSDEEFFKKLDEKLQLERLKKKSFDDGPRKNNSDHIPSIVFNYPSWCDPDDLWEYQSEEIHYEQDHLQVKSLINVFGMLIRKDEIIDIQNCDDNETQILRNVNCSCQRTMEPKFPRRNEKSRKRKHSKSKEEKVIFPLKRTELVICNKCVPGNLLEYHYVEMCIKQNNSKFKLYLKDFGKSVNYLQEENFSQTEVAKAVQLPKEQHLASSPTDIMQYLRKDSLSPTEVAKAVQNLIGFFPVEDETNFESENQEDDTVMNLHSFEPIDFQEKNIFQDQIDLHPVEGRTDFQSGNLEDDTVMSENQEAEEAVKSGNLEDDTVMSENQEAEEAVKEVNFTEEDVILKFVALTGKIIFLIDVNIFQLLDLEELFKTVYEEYIEKKPCIAENDFDQFVKSCVFYLLSLPEFVSSGSYSAASCDTKNLLMSFFYFFKQAITVDCSISHELFIRIILFFKMNVRRLLPILPFIYLLLLHEHRKQPIGKLKKIFITCKLLFKNKVDLGVSYHSTLLDIICWCVIGTYNVSDEDHLPFRKEAAAFYAQILLEKPFVFKLWRSLNIFRKLLTESNILTFEIYGIICTIGAFGCRTRNPLIYDLYLRFELIMETYVNEIHRKRQALKEPRKLLVRPCNKNIPKRSEEINYRQCYNAKINYYRFYCGITDEKIYMNFFKVSLRSRGEIIKMQNYSNIDGLTEEEKCAILTKEEFLACCNLISNRFF